MRHVALFNALLWLLNVVIIGGIVVFACLFLLFPQQENLLKDVVEEPTGGNKSNRQNVPADYSVARNLGNPVIPRSNVSGPVASANDLERIARFLGGHRIADREDSEVAFLQVLATNSYANAYKGQTIEVQNDPVPELRGWTLVRLTENGALFTNGQKEVELRRESEGSAAATPPAGARTARSPGTERSFDPSQSTSRKTAFSETHESWMIDRSEIDWANANFDQLLNDVQLSAYPSGGIKIDMAGEFATSRGFVDQDVIKKVNGQDVADRTDLIRMANDPRYKNAGAVMIIVERAGKQYTLDFRPSPKK